MNSSSPQNQNPEGSRRCSTCRAIAPVTDAHKGCATCWEKARLSSVQRTQQKRASLSAQHGQDHGHISPELKRKLNDREDPVQQEKKRLKTSHASGEVNSKADGKIENKKKELTKQVEYQTSAEIFTKLRTCSKTKEYSFNGSFSIIANTKIDHNQRVTIVAKDLRKVGNVPFEGTSITSFVGRGIFGATFQCSCLDQRKRKHVLTLSRRNPNAVASSPISSTAHTQTNGIPRCKGKVRITSEDDSSHPLGLAGQRITITVEH